MSQHIFNIIHKNQPTEVLIGWDKPLGRYYLVVQVDDDESDDYIYSNLDDETLMVEPIHYQDLGYFKRILYGLDIHCDDKVWEVLKQDKINNR